MTLEQAVWKDPARMSGALCFKGTRIPVSTLFAHLDAGEMEAFYEDFPDVSPDMVRAVLDASHRLLEARFEGRTAA